MHFNYQYLIGKQMTIDPRLLPAWEEITGFFPELKSLAAMDCLQARLQKVIRSRKSDLDLMGYAVGEKSKTVDTEFRYRRNDMLPTILVTSPKYLAYLVGQYIDFAYASVGANLEGRKSELFSETPECSDLLEYMMTLSFDYAEDYWERASTLEQTTFLNNKAAAFARAFEAAIASPIYKAGRVPLSCSENLNLLDPDNPTHNREKMEVVGHPYYAFVLSWRRFEPGWLKLMETLIHELVKDTQKFVKVPLKEILKVDKE